MNFEMILVIVIAIAAVILFATEKLSVDLVALIVLASLLVFGIITPTESISGFSNKATVTVGAMFVISEALFKTGAVNYIGKLTSIIFKKNYWLGVIAVMLGVGFFSAFINNTPVVAIFIPILLKRGERNENERVEIADADVVCFDARRTLHSDRNFDKYSR